MCRKKERTPALIFIFQSSILLKEHGIDLVFKLENERRHGNLYFIEAKGNKRADGSKMRSDCRTNFRFALAQLILRIHVDSRNNNYIYGIAMPQSDIMKCRSLIQKNWALKHLKIRLYGAFYENGQVTAREYLPRDIYN